MEFILRDPQAKLPTRSTGGSCGYDITSIRSVNVDKTPVIVKTGVYLNKLPANTYLRIASRSGLSLKGSNVLAGVIDSDYRGEIGVVLQKVHGNGMVIPAGSRIAQLIVESCITPEVIQVFEDKKQETIRGEGGFGSTGGVLV